MPDKVMVTWEMIRARAYDIALIIGGRLDLVSPGQTCMVYGVPNGGILAAQAVYQFLPQPRFALSEFESEADVFIDDIIDSGATAQKYLDHYKRPFYALYNKKSDLNIKHIWLSMPWERMKKEDGPQDNIRRLIEYIGDDPKREGLQETPDRVTRSYSELFSGYKAKVEDVFKTFESPCDEMIILRDVEFTSFCEHHMIPFIGKATIGYIPKGRVIGLSKLARLLEVYSRRLQIQEHLTSQITAALDKHLQPVGSACVIEAKHLCMCARGVNKQHSSMVTSSLTGAFRDDARARAEFFSFVNGK